LLQFIAYIHIYIVIYFKENNSNNIFVRKRPLQGVLSSWVSTFRTLPWRDPRLLLL